ncbi:MAG: hypothetical protein GY731_05420 [Gammaproteobacteria bacterium]|nr:hypothetical protein [Gammaproteobacteria bacterium]
MANKGVRVALMGVNYFLFMLLVWYLSAASELEISEIQPSYRQLSEDQAVLTMAFSHSGKTVEPCRRRTQEELAKLPPNMRKPMECSRELSPLTIEIRLDGKLILQKVAEPPGLYRDRVAYVFLSTKVPAGKHHVEVRMNDSVRMEGFNQTLAEDVDLPPNKILFIDFKEEQGGFIFK